MEKDMAECTVPEIYKIHIRVKYENRKRWVRVMGANITRAYVDKAGSGLIESLKSGTRIFPKMNLLRLKKLKFPVRNKTRLMMNEQRQDTVLVHGGAGDMSDDVAERKLEGVRIAAREGYIALKETGNVLDAVERAIKLMESDEHFNAGFGSFLTETGDIELDASLMEGADLAAGSATSVKNIKHPITLARLIMVKTKFVMLVGGGAQKFASENGIPILQTSELISPSAKKVWETTKEQKECSGVGAIAIDKNGNLAAGVSAGGCNRKAPGQCDVSTTLGSGIFVDNTSGAVCCSGHAETINRVCLAYSVVRNLANMPLMEAAQSKLAYIEKRFNKKVGMITISKTGEFGVAFTTPRMAWAAQQGRTLSSGYKMDEIIETKG